MLIFQRYIAKKILLPLFVSTILITGLILFFETLKYLYIIDKDITLTQFFSLVSLLIPSLLFIILPLSTVLSVIYIYNALSKNRQLLILKISGTSNISLIVPALLITGLVTIFSYYNSVILIPKSLIKLRTEVNDINNNYFSSVVKPGRFNKISKNVITYLDRKLPDNSMQGVVIFDTRESETPVILSAKYGKITNNSRGNLVMELTEGTRQNYDKYQNINTLKFDSITLEIFRNNFISAINKKHYINELLNPGSGFSIAQMNSYIAEGHERLIWPFYPFLLTFVTLSVFLKIPYNKKSSSNNVLFSALSVVIMILLHFAFINIARKNIHLIFFSYLNCILLIVSSYILSNRLVFKPKF